MKKPQLFGLLSLSFLLIGSALGMGFEQYCTERVIGQGGHEDYACIEQSHGAQPIACYEQIEESCMEGEGSRKVKVYVRYTGQCAATYAGCM